MKERKLQEVTKHLDELFENLINENITEEEFNYLSDELYKRQTRLRYEIEIENGIYYRNYCRFQN
ncbi:hypothetical protein H7S74_19585 [Priestia aryabhattai]|uniref:hypothetical protein n=1 Tax=Priestia TaxID=2800373 RepID=UPI001EB64E4F|nr:MULTISPECIES: hypothetical protein [Priestia]MBY0094738.1 hypothetical protein [Priestia aryabhattai]MBY0103568.1 hypothetical protein [Priestia aryabhattai]MCM3304192.1 hypothetical protein [Priestia megaterium]